MKIIKTINFKEIFCKVIKKNIGSIDNNGLWEKLLRAIEKPSIPQEINKTEEAVSLKNFVQNKN